MKKDSFKITWVIKSILQRAKLIVIFLFLSLGLNAQFNVDFTANPREICVGESVSFTDQTTSANPIVSWAWNFGDGSTASTQNPTHIYTSAGTYNITLTANNGSTSVAEVKTAFILVNPLPNTGFTTPSIGCTVPYSPVFTNVTPASGNNSYSWNFGNGQTSTSQVPTGITYTSAGTYTVSLTVTNQTTGCVKTITQTITVANYNADFNASSNAVCLGQSVSFTNQSTPGTNSWSWNFGNGGLSSVQNPNFTYANPGTYTVTLTAQNTTVGCSDTYTETIVVNPLPQASFTADVTQGCNPLSVDFDNTSVGSGTFSWSFGNGAIFLGENPPTQTYANPGNYTVSLTYTNANGCSSTSTQVNMINVQPLITDFEPDVYEGCEDLAVQFTDLSSSPNPVDNPITGWNWDFGNGSTYSGQNPPVQLFEEGVYTVTLTVTTASGCSDTYALIDSIRVGIPPDVSFTFTPDNGCANTPYDFTSTTPIPPNYNAEDVEWHWYFGDGGQSLIENPTYNYPIDTGFFDVTLIVSLRGCNDTLVVPNAIYIIAPIAKFSPSQSVFCNPTLPLSVPFNDNAILGADGDDVTMIWSWGDGSSNTLTTPSLFTNPNQGSMSHVYTDYGTYFIQQAVYNATTGCADSITQQIHLSAIDADFALSSDSVCRSFPVFMTNTSTSTHSISYYMYNIGNGISQFGPDTTYTYNISGSYDISLFIANAVGCTDTQVFQDFVALQQPVAQILPSETSGCTPIDVIFNNGSSAVGNGVGFGTFNWTLPDMSTQTTIGLNQSINYTFEDIGTFTTTMIATDNFGCVSAPTSVTTVLTDPTAIFSVDSVVCNLESFTTINNSEDFVSSEWILNGSTVSNSLNYSTAFNESNPSNLTGIVNDLLLVVTDVNGCTDTATTQITISYPQVLASYSFDGSNVNAAGEFVCPPVFASLSDSSVSYGSIVAWDWTFGDDNASELEDPENTYVFAGTYSATLNITDEFGCMDSIFFDDYLSIGGPTGDVTWINIGDICNPEFQFIPSNLNNVTNIIWDLGNGETVNSVESFEYIYTNPGTFVPIATLVDDTPCEVEYVMNPITTINTEMTADFSVNPTVLPVFDLMNVYDNSTGGTGGIVSWEWTFGTENFTNNNGNNFNYAWPLPGYQTITLTVTDSLGCSESTAATVYVTAELIIPNVLTANSDGTNDLFVLGEPVFKSYDIIILNRWGNVVSELYDQNGVYLWDGKSQSGAFCADGVYFYRLTGVQYDDIEVSKHGFVTLIVK